MKNKLFFILSVVFIFLSLAACTRKEHNLTKLPASSELLYATNAPIDQEDIDVKVGTIEKRVDSKEELTDWTSIYLQEGTEIYLIKGAEKSEIKYAYLRDGRFYSLNPYIFNDQLDSHHKNPRATDLLRGDFCNGYDPLPQNIHFPVFKAKITNVQDKICYVWGIFGFTDPKYAKIFEKKNF